MKKLLLSTSLFVNIIFLLLACKKEDAVEMKESPYAAARNARTHTAALGDARSSYACTGAYAGMSYALVRNMINNYRTNQLQAIQNSLGFRDANTCWFELEKVKDFICHLETLVAASECDNIGQLGLRFYYAAHDNNPAAYGMPGNYARLHNLVIIPTYQNEDGINVDFDPAKIDPSTCTPLRLNQLGGKEKMENLMFSNSASGNIFAMNHGQLGPPDSLGTGF
jgi:hypothetical protein